VYDDTKAASIFTQQLQHADVIRTVLKDGLPVVTALDDVMRVARQG
jgi:hypothetical protein